MGDRGVDGRIRFSLDGKENGWALVSVKGGGTVNPSMVRDLAGTIDSEHAHLGILIVMDTYSANMRAAASRAGTFTHPLTGRHFPKPQIISVAELLDGTRPDIPQSYMPYLEAKKFVQPQPTLPGING